MHNLMTLIPSARGILPDTVGCIFNIRTELEKVGDKLHLGTLYRMPLCFARNELACAFLSTTCDVALLLDDDCQFTPEWAIPMIKAIDAGCDIVSAPCKLRDHSHGGAQDWSPFNVRPIGSLETIGGLRTLECEMTGLGAVMVSKKVISVLHGLDAKYASRVMIGREASSIFTACVAPATDFDPNAPKDLNVYIQDDVVFSMKARKAGFKIYAAIDIPTVHDGMRGCFSEELEKLQKAQARSADKRRVPLVGPDGQPFKVMP